MLAYLIGYIYLNSQPDVGTFAWSPVVDRNITVPTDEWYDDWDEEDWRVMPENPIKMIWANLHHPQLKVMAGINRNEAANMVCEYQTDMLFSEVKSFLNAIFYLKGHPIKNIFAMV